MKKKNIWLQVMKNFSIFPKKKNFRKLQKIGRTLSPQFWISGGHFLINLNLAIVTVNPPLKILFLVS